MPVGVADALLEMPGPGVGLGLGASSASAAQGEAPITSQDPSAEKDEGLNGENRGKGEDSPGTVCVFCGRVDWD